jgi:hypothetical protein
MLHSAALPLIAYATCGTQESSFLSKEGIRLWLEVVRNLPVNTPPASTSTSSTSSSSASFLSTFPPSSSTPTPTPATPTVYYSPDLNNLLNRSVPTIFDCGLVGEDEEDVKQILLVLEAHAIAGGAGCLHHCEAALLHAFSRTLCQVAPRVVGTVVRPLEAFFITCPREISLCLARSGLLGTLLRPLCAALPALGAAMEADKEADIARIYYLSVVARMVVLGGVGWW